jgi:nucleotide-binding universal stress UspA family protein
MLKHVLVPLDGSALAEEALEDAKRILNPKGRMTLVTVIDLPQVLPHSFYPTFPAYSEIVADESTWSYQYSQEQLLSQAKAYLTHIIDLSKVLTELEFEMRTEIGDPATLIVKTAEQLKVDAIVMSTHGRSGISRWLFGSVTSKVLSAAPCPVFVIPSKQRQHELEQSTSEMNYG